MNHTPTPWKISKPKSKRSPVSVLTGDADSDSTGKLVCGSIIASWIRRRDAAFIIRACNNHQNLLEQLAHAVWVMRSWAQAAQEGSAQYDKLHAAADDAETALKLARGE